ncbi:sensor histidine kinase [Natrononativus amylolyticus]|uniref:sensor histidine kinase n=1 Tax=Natrononativus amylolyticus TaxID=2963434 RepID=UPI0020CE44B3|nr:HAMP domain-containing sensor histidine kinase [Natrononativus amylolyticus]
MRVVAVAFGAVCAVLSWYHIRHAMLMEGSWEIVPQALFPLVLTALLLVAGSRALARLPDREVLRLAAWIVVGMATLALVGVWIISHQLGHGDDFTHKEYVVANAVTAGALGGLAVGWYNAQRQVATRKLRRQNERLEAFAGIVTHDLRNPLAVAISHLSLAREAENPRTHLDELENAHNRMDEIIEELLELARSGNEISDLETVDLEDVAVDAWESVSTEEASLAVTETRALVADRMRLLRVFENLYRNAVEHVGDGVQVRVEATADGFAVEDDGPGYPRGVVSALEDGKHDLRNPAGAGLGLTIVTRIVAAHGWTLSVGTSETGGARIEIRGVSGPASS